MSLESPPLCAKLCRHGFACLRFAHEGIHIFDAHEGDGPCAASEAHDAVAVSEKRTRESLPLVDGARSHLVRVDLDAGGIPSLLRALATMVEERIARGERSLYVLIGDKPPGYE